MIRRFLLLFSVSILVVAVCSGILLTHTADQLSDETLRLHVIANSDDAGDQALKLQVRDAVLAEMQALTASCQSKAEVLTAVSSHLPMFQAVAQETLAASDCHHKVAVSLCKEDYPTRVYENVTLPAGIYDSLQIKLGNASGQNWWCVLFPPLCMGVANAKEELIEVGFTPGQVHLITDTDSVDYVIRFKLLDLFSFQRK